MSVKFKLDEPLYVNFYVCEVCDTRWMDIWDCMCDDRCPECDTSNSPYESREVTDDA